jgi:hypothetical protein
MNDIIRKINKILENNFTYFPNGKFWNNSDFTIDKKQFEYFRIVNNKTKVIKNVNLEELYGILNSYEKKYIRVKKIKKIFE